MTAVAPTAGIPMMSVCMAQQITDNGSVNIAASQQAESISPAPTASVSPAQAESISPAPTASVNPVQTESISSAPTASVNPAQAESISSVPTASVSPAQATLPAPQFEPKQQQVAQLTYTGVIVDATGLGLLQTFSPVIYDTNGRAVYGVTGINPDLAIKKGMVGYAADVQSAHRLARVGINPLVIKAVSVCGGQNTTNKVNVVVTPEDGDRILLANAYSGMLANCSVAFVR